MPQSIVVTAPTALALTVRVFPDGVATQVAGSPFTLTEDSTRKGYYVGAIATPVAGLHHAVIYLGVNPIGNGWVNFTSANGEYVVSGDKPQTFTSVTAEQVWTYSNRTITGFGSGSTGITFPAAEFTTSPVSYCDVAALLDHVDEKIVADQVGDSGSPRPSLGDLSNSGTAAGRRVSKALLAASGEVETACLAKRLYTPADLLSLNGAIRIKLEATVAGIAVLYLYGRKAPATGRHEDLPVVRHALETLEKLRTGERVFGFTANLNAGAGMSAVSIEPTGSDIDTVSEASRFFGRRTKSGE